MVSYNGKELTQHETTILRKLFYHGYIVKRHTDETSVIRGFPGHEKKNAKKAIKSLIKLGLIVPFKSTGQLHVRSAVKKILDEC